MKQALESMKWMGALVVSVGAAACGVTVSEPIQVDQVTASPLTATLLVKDFSAADATAWCGWYVQSAWHDSGPAPASLPVSDGFTCPGAAGAVCGDADPGAPPPNPLCVSEISVEQCVQNLKRRPCEAPVAELDACVLSIVGDGGAGGSFACGGDHCSPFRARPSCDETVVQDMTKQPAGDPASSCYVIPGGNFACRVPVE